MNEIKKSCDTCTYAFYTTDVSSPAPKAKRRQHCKNPVYNSKEYTHTMLMEDWARAAAAYGNPLAKI